MKKIVAAVMTTAILITAFAGCGKEKAAETSTTAQTSENTTNKVTKVTSGNALSIPTDELSDYKQEDDKLVCQNCGNSFTMDQVGEISRGCDPWPILDENKTVTDEEIEISYDFLKDSADIFSNWKKA